ncbi:MAG: hypothetical protein NUV74_10235 [Candidatus Brocadiaceae bacterium]|nr:hypothetical protein [Candidatus Brocadiaceae bacterium]
MTFYCDKQRSYKETCLRDKSYYNKNDNYGSITNKAGREMFKLSDEAALKEIKKLLLAGVVKSEGRGRNVRYLLA